MTRRGVIAVVLACSTMVGAPLVPAPAVAAASPTCVEIAKRVRLHHPTATVVIEVVAPTAVASTATLRVATFTGSSVACGVVRAARVGRAGVRPLVQRRSGDGTTPAGAFPLGRMTAYDGRVFRMFGNRANPGVVAGPYRQVLAGDCFGATPHTARYGHLVRRSAATCTGDDEYLAGVRGAYDYAALIGANMEPSVSGDAAGETPYAAAIFLHRHSYDWMGRTMATAGCVSLAHADLVAVLRSMTPTTWFAIGTATWLLTHA